VQKTITYLYPDSEKASNFKIFQDRTNQIKAFYFTKENIKEIEKMDSSFNYAVYFLFDNSESDTNKVYVGQSMNGVGRISDHVRNKDFWTYCILFVTDNNSFDKLAIDYMEFEFIKKLKKSSYILMNKDLRATEPNVSIYDKPNLLAYINQIEFLLNAEGIIIDEMKSDSNIEGYYIPKNSKYKAKLFLKDGKFVLASGSEINRPIESSKNWKSDRFYHRNNSIIDGYIKDEKAELRDGKIILKVNISYDSPSLPATLISGYAENGWKFFKNLDELRVMNEEV
jgi:hypothetical protein